MLIPILFFRVWNADLYITDIQRVQIEKVNNSTMLVGNVIAPMPLKTMSSLVFLWRELMPIQAKKLALQS
jgi:hypothetical protein